MSKIAVVYWSGTGNTQAMADAVVDGAKLATDSVMANDAPDDNAISECKSLGAALV